MGGPLFPLCVCLALNLVVFTAIALNNPAYLRDYRYNANADARHYVLLGRNFFLLGEYSRCGNPPYVPDYLRTPVYALFAGGLDLLGGAAAIYLVQVALHAVSCLLLYRLVQSYFGRRAAFWASLLLATDGMLVISNYEAMSEPLFTALVLGSAVCLVPAILAPAGTAPRMRDLVGGGLLLALATLARPAGLYLPVVYAVLLAGRGLVTRAWARGLCSGLLVILVAVVPVGAWVVRNALVFSVPRLTHNDAIMLVYFAGGGAYEVEHGINLGQAQKRISKEFALEPPEVTNNHWVSDKSVADMDAELRRAVRPVLSKYPASLVKSSLMGMVKATFSHNLVNLSAMLGRDWKAPGTGNLLRGDRTALERLGENGVGLALVFGWQMAHNLLTWAPALAGLVIAMRRPEFRAFGLCLLALLLYFHLTVALVGIEAFYRSRTPHMPYVFAFAGLAAAAALRPRRVATPAPGRASELDTFPGQPPASQRGRVQEAAGRPAVLKT